MIRLSIASVVPLLALAACASAQAEPQRPASEQNSCHADQAQAFVGQTASADIGAKMLKASGATALRWVPPRTAVSMLFMNGRLTVSYDGAMRITHVSCN